MDYITITDDDLQFTIRTYGEIPYVIFNGYDICDYLGYENPGKAISNYIKPLNRIYMNNSIYIDRAGLGKLLEVNKIALPKIVDNIIKHPIMSAIGLNTFEYKLIDALTATFSFIDCYKYFCIGDNFVTFFIGEYSIIIEKDINYSYLKQKAIKDLIGECKFIYFSKKDTVENVIKQVFKYIVEYKNKEITLLRMKVQTLHS